MASFNLVHEIDAALGSLNRSERKVAEVILADPQAATRASIAVLAKAAGVSEPTVNRFCKRFNTAGFPDFKLHLAQALASRCALRHPQCGAWGHRRGVYAKNL